MMAPAPLGIKVLHSNEDAVWDICFVHGLGGHRELTWTGANNDRVRHKPWPEEFLPAALPPYLPIRVLTYGYAIDIFNPAPGVIFRHAHGLMHELSRERDKCLRRPLIFVAHGMGGLICQQAFIFSHETPGYGDFFSSVCGMIFMGCPVKGPGVVNYLDLPAMFDDPSRSVPRIRDVIGINNEDMIDLQNSMWLLATQSNLYTHCFIDLKVTSEYGSVVVQQETATREPESSFNGIDADHHNMTKFSSREDQGFKQFVNVLTSWRTGPVPLEAIQDLQEILHFNNRWARRNDLDERLPTTCEWLLENARYKEWQSQGGLFQIQGKAGSGKATLAWFAWQNTLATCGLNQEMVLAHFFDGRMADEAQQAPLNFFCSLLSQMLGHGTLKVKSDMAVSELGIRTIKLGKVIPDDDLWQQHMPSLISLVGDCLRRVLEERRVRIFIGGLDESGSTTAADIINFLAKLSTEHNGKNPRFTFHCLFTCPKYFNIPGQAVVSVKAFNKKDIETFVRSELRGISRPHSTAFVAELTNRAGGGFIWVKLVIQKIRRFTTVSSATLLEKIKGMPTKLDEIYHQIMVGLINNNTAASKSLQLFLWVIFARRPVDLDEIGWAQLVESSDPRSLKLYAAKEGKSNHCTSDTVSKLSGGLVEFVPSRNKIVLLHNSVKVFLLKEGFEILSSKIPLQPTAQNVSLAGKAHYQLARTCLYFLAAQERHSRELEGHGFWEYATGWSTHAAISDQYHGVLQDYITERVVQQFQNGLLVGRGDNLLHHLGRYLLCNTLQNTIKKLQEANNGSVPVSILEQRNVDGETPLFAACSHLTITVPGVDTMLPHVGKCAELLIGCGAQVNIVDNKGNSPLHGAAFEGRASVSKLLIDHNAELEKYNETHETALHIAAELGCAPVVKVLLDNGANINARDGRNRTPLHIAIKYGHDPVVIALLSYKPDLNASGGKSNRTPLHGAAKRGYDSIVKLLLDHGANVDEPDKADATALHRAALKGKDSTVRLLLARGASQNKFDEDNSTPLHCAAANGHESTVKLLLNYNAQVNAQAQTPGGIGPTALHLAASQGHSSVVKILLNHNADVNAVYKQGGTPLHEAAAEGHVSVVRILLRRGAQPNAVDSRGATPLDMADTCGHHQVVRLLINHGAGLP